MRESLPTRHGKPVFTTKRPFKNQYLSDLPHLSLLDTIISRWQDTFRVLGQLLSLTSSIIWSSSSRIVYGLRFWRIQSLPGSLFSSPKRAWGRGYPLPPKVSLGPRLELCMHVHTQCHTHPPHIHSALYPLFWLPWLSYTFAWLYIIIMRLVWKKDTAVIVSMIILLCTIMFVIAKECTLIWVQ